MITAARNTRSALHDHLQWAAGLADHFIPARGLLAAAAGAAQGLAVVAASDELAALDPAAADPDGLVDTAREQITRRQEAEPGAAGAQHRRLSARLGMPRRRTLVLLGVLIAAAAAGMSVYLMHGAGIQSGREDSRNRRCRWADLSAGHRLVVAAVNSSGMAG